MAEINIKLYDNAIDGLLSSTDGPVAAELLRRGLKVERAAKRHAPVDTGRLRSSIGTGLGIDNDGLHVRVGTNVEYAIHQEFGTRFQPGKPFLRPALRAAE